jgi:uncharacterized membrane protein YccF (DUF307 family)
MAAVARTGVTVVTLPFARVCMAVARTGVMMVAETVLVVNGTRVTEVLAIRTSVVVSSPFMVISTADWVVTIVVELVKRVATWDGITIGVGEASLTTTLKLFVLHLPHNSLRISEYGLAYYGN